MDEVIRKLLEEAINDLLQVELTSFLEYEPYDRKGFNSGNSRNGSYSRTFNTKLHLNVPRDRNGQFQTQTIPSYERRSDSLEELYSKGITTSEIADLINKMYGYYYTPPISRCAVEIWFPKNPFVWQLELEVMEPRRSLIIKFHLKNRL